MPRFMRTVTFAGLIAGGGAAAQGLPPSGVDEIMAGARSCLAATPAAVDAAFGAPASDDGKAEQVFFTADRHVLDLASTGSHERPAVRVAIGPVPQEQK